MLENLFSSKIRIGLLTLLLTNPEKNYYLREIQRSLGKTLSAIRVELINLEKICLVKSWSRGRIKYYQINKAHPLYEELKSIIYKTEALGDVIRQELKEVANIEAVILYGSIAKNKEQAYSDIDLLIIGTPDEGALYKAISTVEKKLTREINFITFSPEEWRNKIKKKSSFTTDILTNKTIPLIGGADALSRLGR